MNPTNKPLTITLSGKPYHLYFDLNTFVAFEEKANRPFLDFVADMQLEMERVQKEEAKKEVSEVALLQVARKVRMTDFLALVWAGLHTYDSAGEPHWGFTIHQVGSMIDLPTMATMLPTLLTASADNMPEKEADGPDVPTRPEAQEKLTPADNGGTEFGPSDEEILASQITRSEN